MKNKISDLRDALFATLEELRDPESKLTIERAKAINETAQTIINTAKVELEFMDLTGETKGSGFIPQQEVAGLEQPQRARLGLVKP